MSRERISAQQTETTAAEQEQELTSLLSHVVSDVSGGRRPARRN